MTFNCLKFSKTSLFCCNGYSHAIFTILFYESQVEQFRKSITKEKMPFYFYFITFLWPKIPNLAKNRVSNQKSGIIQNLYVYNFVMHTKFWRSDSKQKRLWEKAKIKT